MYTCITYRYHLINLIWHLYRSIARSFWKHVYIYMYSAHIYTLTCPHLSSIRMSESLHFQWFNFHLKQEEPAAWVPGRDMSRPRWSDGRPRLWIYLGSSSSLHASYGIIYQSYIPYILNVYTYMYIHIVNNHDTIYSTWLTTTADFLVTPFRLWVSQHSPVHLGIFPGNDLGIPDIVPWVLRTFSTITDVDGCFFWKK